jgi:hypothetical protein
MPFHFCTDELLALLAMLPVIGLLFRRMHTWWHNHFHHKCHEPGCNDTHVEHCHMLADIPHGKVGEGQCEQHPLVSHKENPYSPYDKKHWHQDDTVSEEDMKYLRGEPVPLASHEEYFSINDHGWGAGVKPAWEAINQETVEARFGAGLVQDLRYTLKGKPELTNLEDRELCWYINEHQELKVEVRGRGFIHVWNQNEHGWDCEHGWNEVMS